MVMNGEYEDRIPAFSWRGWANRGLPGYKKAMKIADRHGVEQMHNRCVQTGLWTLLLNSFQAGLYLTNPSYICRLLGLCTWLHAISLLERFRIVS